MCSYLKVGLALVLSFGCGSHLFGQTIRTYVDLLDIAPFVALILG